MLNGKLLEGLKPDPTIKVSCKLCLDTGIHTVEVEGIGYSDICDCQRERRIGWLLNRLPADYRNVRFGRDADKKPGLYKGDNQLGDILEAEKEYLRSVDDNIRAGRGLTYVGTYRSGKTTRAAAIARVMITRNWKRFSYYFDTDSGYMQALRNEATGYGEIEDGLRRADLVIIDDLGKTRSSEFSDETLYRIIDYRRANCKAVLVTTNYSRAELIDRYPNGAAMLERLNEVNTVITLNEKA